jgi:hypothetical protein
VPAATPVQASDRHRTGVTPGIRVPDRRFVHSSTSKRLGGAFVLRIQRTGRPVTIEIGLKPVQHSSQSDTVAETVGRHVSRQYESWRNIQGLLRRAGRFTRFERLEGRAEKRRTVVIHLAVELPTAGQCDKARHTLGVCNAKLPCQHRAHRRVSKVRPFQGDPGCNVLMPRQQKMQTGRVIIAGVAMNRSDDVPTMRFYIDESSRMPLRQVGPPGGQTSDLPTFSGEFAVCY